MQSARLAGVQNRIIREDKIIEYSNDETEGGGEFGKTK